MRAALFLYAGMVVLAAPLLLQRSWVDRSPRLAILAWQASGVAVVSSLLLVAVLTLSPVSCAELGLGHLLHACVDRLDVPDADAADAAALLPASLLALVLTVTCWRALRARRPRDDSRERGLQPPRVKDNDVREQVARLRGLGSLAASRWRSCLTPR